MATAYNYPGVYIQEVASGVHTIVGVSTSDTAFIDFFTSGPVNQAVRITSFDAFTRTFGGLDTRSEASYAIQQFFLNGGSVAWVVRVASKAKKTRFAVAASGTTYLDVFAANEGAWGDKIQIGIEDGAPTTTFNLVVKRVDAKGQVVRQEVHRNLTMSGSDPNYVSAVVNDASQIVTVDVPSGVTTRPPKTATATIVSGESGSDGDIPGTGAWDGSGGSPGTDALNGGLDALDKIAPYIFNLLCIPAAAALGTPENVYKPAITFAGKRRAFVIVDVPAKVETTDDAVKEVAKYPDDHCALYFPRLEIPDPLNGYRPRNVGASGTVAGIYARVDANRGVWKAPAGIEATLVNANLARDSSTGIPLALTDDDNGALNPFGVNAIRNFPIYGNVVWGARTGRGADAMADDWKYIPVRRLAQYIEESLFQGSKWIVFEPNDEPLWAQIRLNFGAFMQSLFRQGAFAGQSPNEAYFVRCDKNTTTQDDVDRGIVNILVGFAPLKPAEFVVITIQQMAGQIAT